MTKEQAQELAQCTPVVEELAGKRIGMVSKNEMIVLLAHCHQILVDEISTRCYLTTELYCENPNHPTFENWTEENLAELKKELARREGSALVVPASDLLPALKLIRP